MEKAAENARVFRITIEWCWTYELRSTGMRIWFLVECVFIGRNYFLARYNHYVWIRERIFMQLRVRNVTPGRELAPGDSLTHFPRYPLMITNTKCVKWAKFEFSLRLSMRKEGMPSGIIILDGDGWVPVWSFRFQLDRFRTLLRTS